MCTLCWERCVEVIFYHPTVKLHLCFQHQLLCFMGWLQQMCVRPSFHLNPSFNSLSPCIIWHTGYISFAIFIHNHLLILFFFSVCPFRGEFLRGTGPQRDSAYGVCQPFSGDGVHHPHWCLPSPKSDVAERRQSLTGELLRPRQN